MSDSSRLNDPNIETVQRLLTFALNFIDDAYVAGQKLSETYSEDKNSVESLLNGIAAAVSLLERAQVASEMFRRGIPFDPSERGH
jgi:hypothetical protein